MDGNGVVIPEYDNKEKPSGQAILCEMDRQAIRRFASPTAFAWQVLGHSHEEA